MRVRTPSGHFITRLFLGVGGGLGGRYSLSMYNSFVFRKQSLEQEREQLVQRRNKNWKAAYQNHVRPVLLEKYSRRINNFVVRLEEDKKELYEYRQDTEQKAHELLKEIYRKERYLGDPTIKLRDSQDWTSILSTTERIEHERNRQMFESKFGDSSLAFRSIASQSTYNPAGSAQYRTRFKEKEIHKHNMRFSTKSQSFNENRREQWKGGSRAASAVKGEEVKDYPVRRSNSNQSHTEEENRSHAQSVFSFSGGVEHVRNMQEGEESVSNHKQPTYPQAKEGNGKAKVYFKQVVDLQQNSSEPTVKKSLHQILVRFGISRIKDLKKQAMVETDNLEAEDF